MNWSHQSVTQIIHWPPFTAKIERHKKKRFSHLLLHSFLPLSTLLSPPNAKSNLHMELTAAQLKAYDGSDASKPIYLAVRGKIYDVSSGKNFYGPGGAYAVFAGKECARALGKMSKEESDCSADLSGFTEKEMTTLTDWEKKFQAKYPIVGSLV
ncbi:hypothetical protein LUZ60_000804 [Juncus effusus]|nr:hypothetical protein LUZ60_000804 [Juncus effusus]